jgi:hypothetical protein
MSYATVSGSGDVIHYDATLQKISLPRSIAASRLLTAELQQRRHAAVHAYFAGHAPT